jgi:putative peptidoglycan lipid II flippase
VLVLAPRFGVFGLSIGILIGASIHLLVQVPSLFKLPQQRYELGLGRNNPAVREVARLMAPRLLGVAVVQLNFLMNTYLASFFEPEGVVTAITLAFSVMLMPQAAIAQSISIASLPTFSAQVANGKIDEMRSSFTSTLRMILFLSIPAALGLIFLRHDIIRLLYERGQFSAQSTDLVAWALLWYAVGLVGHCIVEIGSRAFYALHDTRTPVFVGVGAMSLNLVFSLLFSRLFITIGWLPHGGLALANSLATFLEALVLLYLMRKKVGGLEGKKLLNGILKALLASSLMVAFIIVMQNISLALPYAVYLLALIVIAAGVYGLSLYLLKVEEIRTFISAVKRRLLKR